MPVESLAKFVKNYAAHGGEIAVRQRRGYRMESWSYGRIAAEANRVARELESRAIAKGDAVLLWGENSGEWIVAFLGCVLCGVVVVPIDHASTLEFASRVAQDVNAKLIFRSATQQDCAGVPSLSLESLVAGDRAARFFSIPFATTFAPRHTGDYFHLRNNGGTSRGCNFAWQCSCKHRAN